MVVVLAAIGAPIAFFGFKSGFHGCGFATIREPIVNYEVKIEVR